MSEQTEPTAKGERSLHLICNRLLRLALTQHSTHDYLREALEEALRATGGTRAFVARIEQESGELVVVETAGEGWTRRNRRLRLVPHNETQRGITGYVAITGEPYLSSDVQADPHHLRIFEDARSEMAVPYFDTEGRVRGVLNIDSVAPHAFNSVHLAIITTLASGIGSALAFDEFRVRERLLVDIGRDLAAITEIDQLASRVVAVAAKALQCEACSVFLTDEATEMLVLQASSSALNSEAGKIGYKPGEGLTGCVLTTGETIRLDDPRTDPRWTGKYPEFDANENCAYLAAPVIGRKGILGVIRVSRPRSRAAWFRATFTESDERMLRTIAGQFGASVDNVLSFNRSLHTERMAAWGELSAKSAHMIGNRTFAIKGDINELKYRMANCAERLKADPTASAFDRELCAKIDELVLSVERGIYRLEEILREFRDFVMATQLKLSTVDLNSLMRETVKETLGYRPSIHLTERYADPLPKLRCDAGKLKRALSELLDNAVSFMPDGGAIEISTSSFAGEDTVGSNKALVPGRVYLMIVIRDTGPGVPADMKSQIFNPFYTSRAKGMGLGLSIVKGIVDAHHGLIEETGEAGAGAQFEILLPAETVLKDEEESHDCD